MRSIILITAFTFSTILFFPGCGEIGDPVRTEVCGNGADDDGDGVADCDDADCHAAVECASAGREVCNDGTDDDGDGVTDCEDADCNSFSDCNANRTREICNNGIDDDGDGLIDCADADCNSFSGCYMDSIEICNNIMDDDGDTTSDCYDYDCLSFMDCTGCPPEYKPIFGSRGYSGTLTLEGYPSIRIAETLLFITSGSGDIRYLHSSNLNFANENAEFNDTTRAFRTPPMDFDWFPLEGGGSLYGIDAPEGFFKMINCLQMIIEYHNVTIDSASAGMFPGAEFPLEGISIVTSGVLSY